MQFLANSPLHLATSIDMGVATLKETGQCGPVVIPQQMAGPGYALGPRTASLPEYSAESPEMSIFSRGSSGQNGDDKHRRFAANLQLHPSSHSAHPMKDLGDIFARLLVTHDRQLRRYIAMLLLRHDDVEEVLQRTAVVLWKKFEEYDQDRDFLPWATRFAYYEVLNFRKEHARSKLVYTEVVIQQLSEMRDKYSDELQERHAALQHCLSKVNVEDRQLLERRYDASLTVKSLAAETGRTVKAIYRRLDRIRAAITECVDRHVASDR